MSTKTILVTGGRSPAALELARYFHGHGHRVLMAECQKHYLSKTSRSVDEVFTVCAPNRDPQGFINDLQNIMLEQSVDLLIPTCEEVFFVSRGKQQLSRCGQVVVDDLEKLSLLHNKWTFNQWLIAQKLLAPSSQLILTKAELKEAIKNRPIVLKPVYSRFASKVIILKAGEVCPELSLTAENPYLAQQFIEGSEYCTYSVAKEGRMLANVMYSHEFTAGRGSGICFEAVENGELQAWISRLVSALNFTGQIAFDFIISSDGGIYPLECNPRATSGVHLLSSNSDFADALLGQVQRLVVPPKGQLAALGLAMWLYGLPSVRSLKKLKTFFQIIWQANECIFSWIDPLPFFYQFVCVGALWRQSLKLHVSLLEASTHDIEWNGEP